MTLSEIRILFGCLWAAVGCAIAIRIGGEPERRAAMLMVICWVATTAVQFLTGRLFEPVLVGDFVYGVGLLWFAARYNRPWIWIMIAFEAVLFFLHASLYQADRTLGLIHLIANNLMAMGGPVVLVIAAVRSRGRRVEVKADQKSRAALRPPVWRIRDREAAQ
ncbi:MAG: hypothetical protein WA840_05025 [Caulobacteraceae bacterium]